MPPGEAPFWGSKWLMQRRWGMKKQVPHRYAPRNDKPRKKNRGLAQREILELGVESALVGRIFAGEKEISWPGMQNSIDTLLIVPQYLGL